MNPVDEVMTGCGYVRPAIDPPSTEPVYFAVRGRERPLQWEDDFQLRTLGYKTHELHIRKFPVYGSEVTALILKAIA